MVGLRNLILVSSKIVYVLPIAYASAASMPPAAGPGQLQVNDTASEEGSVA